MAGKIVAVGYVRMSTDRQEKSPEQQRIEVEAYAEKHGYRIIDWYEDLAVSGDRTDKRLQFQRMIEDGSVKKFDAILCWNQDRFGRFDAIEAGRWIYPLREAGVHLATVTDGLIDWTSMAGRITYSVTQEGKHQYLSDLSKNVSRSMDQMAKAGKWIAGVPPFGYVVGDDQRLQLGDEADVELVREIFRRYDEGESTRSLSLWLSEQGIQSPKGKTWTATGIGLLLKNERYLGYLIYNQRTSSKFKDGVVNPKGQLIRLPRDKWTIVEDTHPAIIDRETFDRVQERFKSNKRKTHADPDSITALSGLLQCGQCGSRMICDRSNGVPKYTCKNYWQRPGSCKRYTVRESEVLKLIISKLRSEYFDKVLTPTNINRLKKRMRELLGSKRQKSNIKIAKNQAEKIASQIEQARRRLVEVEPDMIRHVEARIRELEDQRDALRPILDQATETPEKTIDDIEKRIQTALNWLSDLEAIADTDYDSAILNRTMKAFVDKVELDIERVQWGPTGKRFRCNVTGGRIYLRTSDFAVFLGDNNSGPLQTMPVL
ncbi:recombinase family protein [Stieleria sp. JC731]|uniref:recombinase family protein n=1 Tax=Pirellulaceae TaxID=2691357 RepID=UPI001E3F5143|nr:recombinase family protein [Stieleria sp. JC731]MCC9600759.1 recombinase family protein [Stieleria sp. JC731]